MVLIAKNPAQATINPMADTFAQVAVDHPVDGELTYRVPAELEGDVVVGSRVTVPLGRGNRKVTGTVMALLAEEPAELPEEEEGQPVESSDPLFPGMTGDDFAP